MKREEKLRFKGVYIHEKCPQCRSEMIGNQAGEKWCSQCSNGLLNFEEIIKMRVNERILPKI